MVLEYVTIGWQVERLSDDEGEILVQKTYDFILIWLAFFRGDVTKKRVLW